MNREQALQKIAKCLRLSKSANEHEAAAAMRQAQALMREHRLSADEVDLVDVHERATKASTVAINKWDVLLARTVADAFGCDVFSVINRQLSVRLSFISVRQVVFVGVGTAATVATYAYDVLSRQCVDARIQHVRKQPASCKQVTKTARGDRFAEAWVAAVASLVERFAGTDGERRLLERYMAANHSELKSVKPKDKSVGRNVRDADALAGWTAGKAAQLDRGLGNAAPLKAIAR